MGLGFIILMMVVAGVLAIGLGSANVNAGIGKPAYRGRVDRDGVLHDQGVSYVDGE